MFTMWSQTLKNISENSNALVAGLMSGTSADGVDVALCEVTSNSTVKLVGFEMVPYPKAIHDLLDQISSWGVKEVAVADILIGEAFGNSLIHCLGKFGVPPNRLDLVGSHGQTVFHHSSHPGLRRSSLQLGCADTIASICHVPVVFDFRRKDIANGGEGAPLTPYADYFLFGGKNNLGVLNLGGIANITVLGSSVGEVTGFDVGPANAPLDRIMKIITGGKALFDKDGLIARGGKVNQRLLKELLANDVFLKKAPPKSTGFEEYGDAFVQKVMGAHGVADSDLLATIVEFVVEMIAQSMSLYCAGSIKTLIIAGGGARNLFLVERIREKVSPISVKLSDEVGVPVDAREAIAFSLLALHAVRGVQTSLPKVTGAIRPSVLGKVAFP